MVLAGEQYIVADDGSRVRVTAGQAIFLRRGLYTVSDLISNSAGSFYGHLVYFTGRGLSIAAPAPPHPVARPFPYVATPSAREAALSAVAQLPGIAEILTAPHRQDPVACIHHHFDKPLTLAGFAYLPGQSVSTFQRGFRARTGKSPRNYIVEQRMAAARELLRDKRVASVREAAAAVGYRDTSHFIAVYRRVG